MRRLNERDGTTFTLIEHVCAGSLKPPETPGPSVLLVVSGRAMCADSGQGYGVGEAFTPQDRRVFRGNATLWQFVGQLELIGSLKCFSKQLARKDPATAAHAARVARLAADMGCCLGLSRIQHARLGLAAYLHDLGKLILPTELLRKPKCLTLSERMLMEEHPYAGKRLLEATPLAFLGTMVEQHHERFDGSGYPYGLRGDEVSLESYVVAVADTFDAMTHDRPYRRAQSRERASAEINRCSGDLFPREVVAAFDAVTDGVTGEVLAA